jgi:hypothetical protein
MLPAGWTGRESTANYSKLGFNVAQSSVAKYMVKRRGPPSQGWKTFCQTTFRTLPPWICSWSQAFPWDEAPRYMIADRDQIYGAIVTRPLRAMGNHVLMRYAFIEGIASDCHSACNIDPPYCLICRCYPDGAIADDDPMSIDRPRQVAFPALRTQASKNPYRTKAA